MAQAPARGERESSDAGVDPFSRDVERAGGYLYASGERLSSRLANERITGATLALSSLRGRRLIDVGCGDGTYTVEVAVHGGVASALGVDPSESAIGAARAREAPPEVGFAVGSAYALPHERDAFDLAYLRGVLHHTERPVEVLAEALRVAPDVVVVEPNGLNPGLKLLERVSGYHREHRERSFAPRTVDRWIAEAGAVVAARRLIGFVPMFCPDWYARLAKRVEPALERMPPLRSLCCAQYVVAARRDAAV